MNPGDLHVAQARHDDRGRDAQKRSDERHEIGEEGHGEGHDNRARYQAGPNQRGVQH